MCAGTSPSHALAFALALQREFYEHDWATEELDDLYAETCQKGDARDCWNGLRVRVGIHHGCGDIRYDAVSKGYDYYGTVVNTASRIESVCHGGQIGVSQAVRDALGGTFPDSEWQDLGPQLLKGLTAPIHLYQVLPAGILARRRFPPLRIDKEPPPLEEETAEVPEGQEAQSTDTHHRRSHAQDFRSHDGSSRVTHDGFSLKWIEAHPLVLRGEVAAGEFRRAYDIVHDSLAMLFATQPAKWRHDTMHALCGKLHVSDREAGHFRFDHGLHEVIRRVLPAAVARYMGTHGLPTRSAHSSAFVGPFRTSMRTPDRVLQSDPSAWRTESMYTDGVEERRQPSANITLNVPSS
eukprot:TRINITY_DN1619_c0_g1_i5.p1 TRINITY_DN1619_c0_g1~~TRINITY_DN1619_c0_g1_i5.p1  ORF type:complete len:351 (-),score=100.42 TRINITY_DN1619_c0_g1_i5:562-1614(-)